MSVVSELHGWFHNGFSAHSEARPANQKKEGSATVIVDGDFRLDLAAQVAYLRGEQLDLSIAEFDLLHYLLKHQRKFITPRTQLSTAVPNTSAVRSWNFLQTLMSLRKKIDAVCSGKHYLKTEPWVVYGFNASGNAEP